MKLTTAIDLFLLDCQLRRLKSRSIQHYEQSLKLFVEATGVTELEDITSAVIVEFQTKYSGKSAQYVKNLLVAVSIFLKYHDKSVKFRYPKVGKKVKKSFTKSEISLLLKSCNKPVHKLVFLFALDTGCRLNEIRQIDVQDVDLKQGLVLVKHGKTGERFVPIGVRVRKELLAYLDGRKDNALFLSQQGKRFSINGLVNIFKTLRKRTGIAHCTSHTARRTFATSMSRAGMNIHVLAKLMGHSDLQTLKQYLDISNDDLKEQHAMYSFVDNI
jgi:integrase/recombinase XerD